jgi:hypothetical protein
VAACEGVEFVTDTITIACSADRTCEVAKAMEITFAFGSLFLERELSKMWWRASCLPIEQPTKTELVIKLKFVDLLRAREDGRRWHRDSGRVHCRGTPTAFQQTPVPDDAFMFMD